MKIRTVIETRKIQISDTFPATKHTFYVDPFFGYPLSLTDGEFLSYAFGILSEYLTIDLCEKLSQRLGLEKPQAAQPGNKRKSLIELEHKSLKRVKSEEDFSAGDLEPIVRPLAIVPEKKLTAKDVKMAKAASGTKSISSFFSKK